MRDERMRATKVAYTTLKRDLLSGTIRPGERIVDSDICRRLKVSRTPVREALLALERDGLVRIVPRQGYFATEIGVSEALDAYQLRIVLEPLATALAARRISDDELHVLRELLAELAVAEADPSDTALVEAIELNKKFHVLIAEASGNARLARVLSDLLDALGRLVLVDLRTRRASARTWRDEHEEILAALEARDPDRALAVVRETYRYDEGLLFARARGDLDPVLGSGLLSTEGRAGDGKGKRTTRSTRVRDRGPG
jgi:DNA-binding GntR family transcriptional regulator